MMKDSFAPDLGDRPRNLKEFACLRCRHRKIKCDRQLPSCTTCIKAKEVCNFVPPTRGKRKRTKPPREGLHAKLKRYEELMTAAGIKIEPDSDPEDKSETESVSEPRSRTEDENRDKPSNESQDQNWNGDRNSSSIPGKIDENTVPRLIRKGGTSRYIDNALWLNLRDQFDHPDFHEYVDTEVTDCRTTMSEALLGMNTSRDKDLDLTTLHPRFEILSKLKDIFVDRVDPVLKILHVPSFWAGLNQALNDPQPMSKSMQAEAFSFYYTAIGASDELQCKRLFGEGKIVMLPRYRVACQRALVEASFLATTSIATLRAYALYLVFTKYGYGFEILYVLSAVGIRLARKIGLHRDGSSLGLSPFESELRRRLWYQLARVDSQISRALGLNPSLDLSCGDVKKPRNVPDEDLFPEMIEDPPEHDGITSVSFLLFGYELTHTMNSISRLIREAQHTVDKDRLATICIDMAEIIADAEEVLETRYLRYCDPTNGYHTLLSVFYRAGMCDMRLSAYMPKHTPQRAGSEKNIVLTNSLQLLRYLAMLNGRRDGLRKFHWIQGSTQSWKALLSALIEARRSSSTSEIETVWDEMEELYAQWPAMFMQFKGSVSTAVVKWTLELWEHYLKLVKAESSPIPDVPGFITALYRTSKGGGQCETSNGLNSEVEVPAKPSLNVDAEQIDFASFDTSEFPSLLSFENDPSEWMQWEQIFGSTRGFN